MFKDDTRSAFTRQLQQSDWHAFSQILTPTLIAQAASQCTLEIVASPLAIPSLVWLAVAAAWLVATPFADMFRLTQQVLQDQNGYANSAAKKRRRGKSKHSPKPRDITQLPSEEAFVKARKRLPFEFWLALVSLLSDAFAQKYAQQVTFRGLRLLAMDGTLVNLPNWGALRKAFGAATNQSAQARAQARLVLLQFPLARIPFRFELTALREGEITVAKRLVAHLQANDLLLWDAGFWSYGLFWAVQQRGAFFAIRLTQKAKFKTLKKYDRNDRLVRWTPSRRWPNLPVSMDLRILRYKVPGFRTQQIVTNLLDRERLSYEDWFRLSWECDSEQRLLAGVYHRRWEIETTFRELKSVQGMEKGLRSRTAASIRFEIAGHILLYLLLRWLIMQAAEQSGCEPLQLSFAHALAELQGMRVALLTASVSWAKTLVQRLLDRIASHRVTWRPGRWFPRRKSSSNHRRAQQKRNRKSPVK